MNFSVMTTMSMLMADGTEKKLGPLMPVEVQQLVLDDAVQLDDGWGSDAPSGQNARGC